VAEPAAVGGVTFQPFPDPRPVDGFGPVPAFADEVPPVTHRPTRPSSAGSVRTPAFRPEAESGRSVPSPRSESAKNHLPGERPATLHVAGGRPGADERPGGGGVAGERVGPDGRLLIDSWLAAKERAGAAERAGGNGWSGADGVRADKLPAAGDRTNVDPATSAPRQSVPDGAPAGRGPAEGRRAAAAGHRAVDGEDERPDDADESPGGRHTVPDELVRAATYRLPPDRVFRAKVRDTAEPPDNPDDPRSHRPVPKPRQS
jgi:hypothetical protein